MAHNHLSMDRKTSVFDFDCGVGDIREGKQVALINASAIVCYLLVVSIINFLTVCQKVEIAAKTLFIVLFHCYCRFYCQSNYYLWCIVTKAPKNRLMFKKDIITNHYDLFYFGQ